MPDFNEIKNKAFKFHQENNLEEAEKYYLKALTYENNAEVNNLLGIINLQKNNLDLAVEYIKKAINIEKNPYFYETLFQVYVQKSDFQKIADLAKDVEILYPNEFSLIFNIALANKNLNKIKDGIYYYKKAVKINPKSYDVTSSFSSLISFGSTVIVDLVLSLCSTVILNSFKPLTCISKANLS